MLDLFLAEHLKVAVILDFFPLFFLFKLAVWSENSVSGFF
jgi:hypothetical protein